MHWLQRADAILRSNTHDLRELALIAGGKPETFYLGAALEDVNLCGQDLRGMRFTNLGKATILFDQETRLDAPLMAELDGNPKAIRVIKFNPRRGKPSKRLADQVDKVLRELTREPRASDRTAKLLARLIGHPEIADLLLDNYPAGESTTVDRAVETMKGYLDEVGARPTRKLLSIFVARTAEELLKRVYVYNRPLLLTAFVEHLGRFTTVRGLLIAKVRQSNSWQIRSKKKELLAALSAGRTADPPRSRWGRRAYQR